MARSRLRLRSSERSASREPPDGRTSGWVWRRFPGVGWYLASLLLLPPISPRHPARIRPDRLSAPPAELGVEGIPQGITEEIEGEDRQEDRHAWPGAHPPHQVGQVA